MALNLWKIGGQPVSYSPLPLGMTNYVTVTNNIFILSVRAKSNSNNKLAVTNNTAVQLTTDFATYTFTVDCTAMASPIVRLYDNNQTGDIIIDSISLVQKPLSKLTINGIDGFLSGKWTLNSNCQVVNDSTLILNATALYQDADLTVNVLPNTNYTFSINGNGKVWIRDSSSGSWNYVNSGNAGTTYSFTTTSAATTILIRLENISATGVYTFSNLMLNLGSVPAPFEPKRGDKMMLPAPKKNLFNLKTAFDGQAVTYDTGILVSASASTTDFIPISPNTNYVRSTSETVVFYDSSKQYISSAQYATTFTTPSNAYFIRANFKTSDKYIFQIEKGTTATSYTPYAVQENKKPQRITTATKGLSFNGVVDAITFPDASDLHLSNVSIETWVNLNLLKDFEVILHKGEGASLTQIDYALWVYASGNCSFITGDGTQTNSVSIASLPINQWVHVVGTFDGTISNIYLNGVLMATYSRTITLKQSTNNLYIGRYSSTNYASPNGAIKYVKIYDRSLSPSEVNSVYDGSPIIDGLVRSIDFTNTNNIIGNMVAPNAHNLIPKFEDNGWSLHQNAKVLGKDVLHLDATTGNQDSFISIPCLPNTTYIYTMSEFVKLGSRMRIGINDGNGAFGTYICESNSSSLYGSFTTNATTTSLTISLINDIATAQPYDFISPQLYQLNGQEGTIHGTPIQLNAYAARKLYSKR